MRLPVLMGLIPALALTVLAENEAGAGALVLLESEDYEPPAGTEVVTASKTRMKTEKMSFSVGDLELAGSLSMSSSKTVHIKQLGPNRARRLLKELSKNQTFNFLGNEQAEPEEKDALLDIPVILERRNGTWSARLENGEPTKEQEEALSELEDDSNTDDDLAMYGTEPRRVGETWEVDASRIPGLVDQADGVKGKLTLTLVRRMELNGSPCAYLTGTIDCLALRKAEADEEPDTKIGLKGTVEVTRSLEHFADLAWKLKGEMTIAMDGPSPQGPLVMRGSGPFEFSGGIEFNQK
jgi:hypothetical protein